MTSARLKHINIYMANLSDLESKGYCVIKNFLTPDILDILKTDYAEQLALHKEKKINLNYNVIYTNHLLNDTLLPILSDINKSTNITIDHISQNGLYIDTHLISFDWHQDHETYYIWQDSYNAVNFWIPIIKPEINKSGLSIIPHDALLDRCPEIFNTIIKGKGAKTLKQMGSKTLIMDEETGDQIILDFDINQLAITPDLGPGDLFLIREDIIHKTQDIDTCRTAISIRAINSNTILSKAKLLNGCKYKQKVIVNNPAPYQTILRYFKNNNIVECSIAEILPLM
jgi:hypothetical protein